MRAEVYPRLHSAAAPIRFAQALPGDPNVTRWPPAPNTALATSVGSREVKIVWISIAVPILIGCMMGRGWAGITSCLSDLRVTSMAKDKRMAQISRQDGFIAAIE